MQKLCPGHLNSSLAQVLLQFSSSLKSIQLYSPLHCILRGMQRPFAHLYKEKRIVKFGDSPQNIEPNKEIIKIN